MVKDGVLRVLRFTDLEDGREVGLVVQWNCHPEALGADNQLITADFPAATIASLSRRYACPVAYFTGAIGGLLAPPPDRIRDEQGQLLEGGRLCVRASLWRGSGGSRRRAIDTAQPIRLTPFQVSAVRTGVPMTNELYRWARLFGVMRREAFAWQGEGMALGEPLPRSVHGVTAAIETEVACLRLGELLVAAIPGELFPELVRGPIEDPAQPGADFRMALRADRRPDIAGQQVDVVRTGQR